MQLEDMFDKKDLIGVSLKKTGKNAKIELKNSKNTIKKQYIYEGYKTTSKSKDITLLYNEGQICFRTFNYATNWAGEILGKTANHGKIGFGPINSILKKYDIELKTTKEIKQLWEEHEYIGINSLMILFTTKMEILPKENFDIFIQDKTIDWKVSKLLGLLLLERIETQPKEIQNKIITELVRYSSSESDESSIFLKIS
jgi:hypothetical protein